MGTGRHKFSRGWRECPHFYDAHLEAQRIVNQLWQNAEYGRSRERNGKGAAVKHAPRFCDRFVDRQHAVVVVTKVVLRDKWGERPVGMREVDLEAIGGTLSAD
jgi:hypothetical protein